MKVSSEQIKTVTPAIREAVRYQIMMWDALKEAEKVLCAEIETDDLSTLSASFDGAIDVSEKSLTVKDVKEFLEGLDG